MFGLSPKLPVQRDPSSGFALTKTYEEVIKQNLKNLVLTSPGERMMDINFGVGIRDFLFEPNVREVRSKIDERIRTQVTIYMPFVEIRRINFFSGEDISIRGQIRGRTDAHPNKLHLVIEYFVLPLGVLNALAVSVDLV
tara:strand:- start:34 stop:450 length:417 start_codon:yes stop_codon:yes gene_type:complete